VRAAIPTPSLAIDLPGHGGWHKPIRGFERSVTEILADLPAGVDRVVGYSMGGRFALGLMAREPRRFRQAILISTHPGLDEPRARRDRQARDAAWATHLNERGLASFVEAWSNQPLFASQRDLPAEVLERQRRGRLAQDARALADSLRHHGLGMMPSLWQALVAFPGDLTLLVGERDTRFVAIAHEIDSRRPRTRLQILRGVGHNPLLECPEALACAIRELAGRECPEQDRRTGGAAPFATTQGLRTDHSSLP
jgi:2-succinyl-6-hydroxy-2,4-cyclohexadiene-1-carboxylate synthase